MSSNYTNLTLQGPRQQQIAEALSKIGRNAFVSPTVDQCTVIFDEECEEQQSKVIADLACRLSKMLSCPILAVGNQDDEVLWYQLYQGGALKDEYESTPGYYSQNWGSSPCGGNAEVLCHTFEKPVNDQVEPILRSPKDGDYILAKERHADLVNVLQLPSFSVGYGYNYLAVGDVPVDLDDDELKHIC